MSIDSVDAQLIVTLRDRADTFEGVVGIDITAISRWPDSARWLILSYAASIAGRIQFRVDDEIYSDLFRGVLAAMTGTDDLAEHSNSIRAAIEAAALFIPLVAPAATKLINDRLSELGAARMHPKSLEKQINTLAASNGAASNGADECDAHTVAARYYADLRAAADRADDERILLFYRSVLYQWNGRSWRPLSQDALEAQVTRFLQEQMIPWVSRNFAKDVVANLKALAFVDCWDQHAPFFLDSREPLTSSRPNLIVFRNVVLDLAEISESDEAPVLREHDSRYFNTIELPFDFDPDARCPRYTAFLGEVLPQTRDGDQRQQVLHEFMGYTFLRDCRFEKMLAMTGDGSNGKSTILKVVEGLLGEGNVAHIPFNQLGTEYRLYDLANAAANVSAEMGHMGRSDEGLLKQLISGEPVTVNRKHLAPVTIRSSAKLILAANDLPPISDTSRGMWRRILAIPFDVQIPENRINVNLGAELMSELPGILNLALAGLRRLLAQGGFTPCERSSATLENHRRESDSVAECLSQCFVRVDGWESESAAVFELYTFWAAHNQRKPVSGSEFGKRMRRLGQIKRRATRVDGSRPWVYARLRTTSEAARLIQRLIREKRPGWTNVSSATPSPQGQSPRRPGASGSPPRARTP